MGDFRETFIVNCVQTLCPESASVSLDDLENQPLSDFLNDTDCTVLQASIQSKGKVILSNSLEKEGSWSEGCVAEIHFVKLIAEPLTDKNISTNVQVISMLQSPIHSLYHTLNKLYAPMLLKGSVWEEKLSQKVKELIMDLDTGLSCTVRDGVATNDQDQLAGIINPNDEVEYWENNSYGKNKERGKKFMDAFDAIQNRFSNIMSLNFDEMEELIEDTHNSLDDIWRAELYGDAQYPQARMANFLRIVSHALYRYVVHQITSTVQVWTSPFNEVRPMLSTSITLCERWVQIIDELTGTFWPSFDEHPWKGEKYSDTFLMAFKGRLQEVLRLRTTYEELLHLLPEERRDQFKVDDCFKPFAHLYPLNYNPYTQKDWGRAVAEFEKQLEPIESFIADKLQTQLARMVDKPQAALREFSRYKHLIRRPFIWKTLSTEMESLLAQLSAHIDQLDRDFDQHSVSESDHIPSGKILSAKVSTIVWGQQLISRLNSLNQSSKALLGGLSNYDQFTDAIETLLNKANGMVDEQVRSWQEEVEDLLRDGEISLEMSGKLMQIDVEGNLVVNYSERLVTLLREVRQLTELSAVHKRSKWVPKKIMKVALEGEKYYRYGVTLKKVANFYNTMGAQMIEEQKPMLLNALLAFEEVVKHPSIQRSSKNVTWSNLEECEEYVVRLQQACETLSMENRKLRRAHTKYVEDVVSLMDIDLLRHREKWKSKWNDMKTSMAALSRKYSGKHMQKWILHWDHQLYKALEASYQMGLESLNQNLPEIKSELVFVQRKLTFKPPIEELRATYFKEMKKFISVPNAFQGFGTNGAIFSSMSDHNAKSLVQVYRSAETLFDQLDGLRRSLEPWTVLGKAADIDSFVEEHVTEVAEWEENFKMLKTKRKESDKLADYNRIDCILVSAVPLKSAIDEMLQRLNDALILTLRKSVLSHLNSMDTFLDDSMEKLNSRPHSIDEIGIAKKNWKEIDAQRPNIQAEYKKCAKKRTLLVSVAGANIDTTEVATRLADMPSRWENFEIALEAFNEMIEEQRESLKGEIESQIVECNIGLDKFSQRWHTLKPTEISTWEKDAVDAIFTSLEEWREQFDEQKNKATTLISNCETFQMPAPIFEGLEALEHDISALESSWNMYKEFSAELIEIGKQDWITFRSHMFDLQDVGQKWADKLKGQERTSVVLRISEQVAQIRKSMPALKFCRGDPFKEEHWTQLFRKLGIPKGVRLENLTLSHFLDCLPALENPQNLQFVKVLQARAQGEVTIREALQELRAWTETAELSLLEHEENGRVTPIIKDWKEITLELGDNQSLLASLKESQFFKPFADQAVQYEVKMSALDQYLTHLNVIQRKWIYLEPIFGRGALPSEQGRFKRVDEEFCDIMQRIQMEPKLFDIADESLFPHLGDRLSMMVDQLERCQKALADFLEEKRSKMPRFYFIGDDDLVSVSTPLICQAVIVCF